VRALGTPLPSSTIHGKVVDLDWLRSMFSVDDLIKETRDYVSRGFTAVKLDLDIPTAHTRTYELRSGDVLRREVDYLTWVVGEVRGLLVMMLT